MELKLINELSESKLFRSTDLYRGYSLEDIANLTYIYILSIELFRTTDAHKEFVRKYVRSVLTHSNFDSFRFSSNDLYHFLHVLLGKNNQRQLDNLSDSSHHVDVDFLHIKKFLREVMNDKMDMSFDQRFLLRIEKELSIKNSNLKSIRRMVVQWLIHENTSMKKAATTKLLLELRKRVPKSEIRHELEKLAKEKLDEYKLIQTRNYGGGFGSTIGNKLAEAKIIKITAPTYQSQKQNFLIYKNPTGPEVESLLIKNDELRGVTDYDQNIYIWKAVDSTHMGAQRELDQISDLRIRWDFDFVFSTDKGIDAGDWADLTKIGDYYYKDEELFRQQMGWDKQPKNNFLVRIFNYLRKDKLDEYKIIKTDIMTISGHKTINIYKNPSHRELVSLLANKTTVRGLIDTDLYVWDAALAIHYEIEERLEIKTIDNLWFTIIEPYETKYIGGTDGIFLTSTYDRIYHINNSLLDRALGFKDKIDEYKLIKTNYTNVYKNPMRTEFLTLLNKYDLRGLSDTDGNLYIWDANYSTHGLMEIELEIDVNFSAFPPQTNENKYYFAKEFIANEWNLKEVNGVWFEAYYKKDLWKNKNLARIMGFTRKDKLDEYKIIKIAVPVLHRNDYVKEYKILALARRLKVYQNPTHTELKALLKSSLFLRGIVDNKGYLYVWDGNDEIHSIVENELDLIDPIHYYFSVTNAGLWNPREVNGIFIQADRAKDSKFLKRALGIKDKIDEYKLIKAFQSIDWLPEINIFKNPTRREFLSILNKTGELRGLIDTRENLYVWNAGDSIHKHISDHLTDLQFYDQVFFSSTFDVWDEWDLEDINGIFFGSLGQNLKRTRKAIDHSKHLKRALGIKNG